MSTTRKIEGLSIQLGNRKFRFTEESGAPMATEERATLVIGGKCLTEEEHEAEFQRRAKAFLLKLRADYHAVEDIDFLDTLAYDELGIKLP